MMMMEKPQAQRHTNSQFSDLKSPIRTEEALLQIFLPEDLIEDGAAVSESAQPAPCN
jgi:hypothetical protein